MVICTNEDCQCIMKRKELESHCDRDCLKQVIPCPLEKYGCNTLMAREKMQEHIKIDTHKHLEKLVKKFSELSLELAELRQKVNEKDDEIKELKSALGGGKLIITEAYIFNNGATEQSKDVLSKVQALVRKNSLKIEGKQFRELFGREFTGSNLKLRIKYKFGTNNEENSKEISNNEIVDI